MGEAPYSHYLAPNTLFFDDQISHLGGRPAVTFNYAFTSIRESLIGNLEIPVNAPVRFYC